ncbi:MAG: hypothetical protein ACRDK0_15515 [Solirubrobacteraceae bacterium]
MRRIISTQLQATGAGATIDGYFDRIIKFIPGDIVAAWVTISGILQPRANAAAVWWGILVVLVGVTYWWTLKQTALPNAPPGTKQAIVSTLAFLVWTYALGGPFATQPWYDSGIGAVLMIVFTLVSGRIVP